MPHPLTPTNSIFLVMVVAFAALPACQLRAATSDSIKAAGRATATQIAAQRTQEAVLRTTVHAVETTVATYATDQASQSTPVVVTVTPLAATTPTATPEKVSLSTGRLAEAYLAALVAEDREGVLSLLTLGPVCTPSDFRENIEHHLHRFSASQVRNIRIEVEAGSPTMHGPQSEVAHISFEHKRDVDPGWRLVRIWIATVKVDTNHRGICDVSRMAEYPKD